MNYIELKLTLKFTDTINNWQNISSTIRGIWGRALKKIFCYQKNIDCINCSMRGCPYFILFEKKYGEYEQYHPYIIFPESSDNDTAIVNFKFFGWICDDFDKIFLSLLSLNTLPVIVKGKKINFYIESILDSNDNIVYQRNNAKTYRPVPQVLEFLPKPIEKVTVHFVRPYRQKYQGKLLSEFKKQPFFDYLLNRIRFINLYFNDKSMNLPEEIDSSKIKLIESKILWEEQLRKSFRQKSKMSLGGLVGTVVLESLPPDAYGILKLGEYLHTGKQTTFGNGKYIIS